MHASTVLDVVSYNLRSIHLSIGVTTLLPHVLLQGVCLRLQSVGYLQPYSPNDVVGLEVPLGFATVFTSYA
jgi:hypothetical protein